MKSDKNKGANIQQVACLYDDKGNAEKRATEAEKRLEETEKRLEEAMRIAEAEREVAEAERERAEAEKRRAEAEREIAEAEKEARVRFIMELVDEMESLIELVKRFMKEIGMFEASVNA